MIGKIEKVPLRTIWKHEASGFTRWLQENIDVLNSVLDFNLASSPEREQSTGNFNVDLVAEDENGNLVVIENQLEKSNHDHLGKVITYLAAVGASKAIWIVSEPRQEHIKAIAWLNESTSAEFYLLKIEGIKIGDSSPAPLLTLIVGPSREVKEAGKTKKEYAERHHLRRQFWEFLLGKAKSKTRLHSGISSGTANWIGTGAGTSGLGYNYVIGEHESRVELYVDKGKGSENLSKTIFEELLSAKDKIENVFGESLSWEPLENKRACRIAIYFENGGYRDADKWEDVAEVMIDAMVRLEKALSPFISKLRTL